MASPLTTQALDDATSGGCQHPDCNCQGKLVITSRCHPGKGTNVIYQKGDGFISVTCHVCDSLIVQLAIAVEEVH